MTEDKLLRCPQCKTAVFTPTKRRGQCDHCDYKGDFEFSARTEPATPDDLVERLWARRHELTEAEWLEAAPILLGMTVASPLSNERTIADLKHDLDRYMKIANEECNRAEANERTIERLLAGLGKAIETLAAGRYLIGKYTPDHHWLAEHDNRIDELKALAKEVP